MTEWPMPQVVNQASQVQAQDVLVGDFELGLIPPQRLHEITGKVCNAQRVLEATTRSPSKDIVDAS